MIGLGYNEDEVMILIAQVMLEHQEDLDIVIGYLKELQIDYFIGNKMEGFLDWQKHKPDFLIIDEAMNFESKDKELIKLIRKYEYDHHTYILMVEKNDQLTTKICLECGIDDFMGRPFTKEEFSRRMYSAKKTISLVEQNFVVYALSRVFEARDKGALGHLSRVSNLSKILMEGLEEHPKYRQLIDQTFKDDLMISCQLHDIGKIGIDDIILKKPGQYTKDEFAKMKEHVIIGYDIIKAIKEKYPKARFLNMAQEIIRHHHEKFDGSGYPDGLKGEAIPLSARLVGLADFYDALTSKRVYKRKYSHEEAKKIIVDHKGTHFDPMIVDVFLENEQAFKKICEEHGEF